MLSQRRRRQGSGPRCGDGCQPLRGAGGYYHTVCPNFTTDKSKDILTIAISFSDLQARCERGVRTQLGQLLGIIGPGAILAVSAHTGLMRRMLVGENHTADQEKIALVLNPENDAYLAGDTFGSRIDKVRAPEGQVFVVYLSPNLMRADYPKVDFWIEHWTWIHCDPRDKTQPFGYAERYEHPCSWTKI